MSLHDVFTVSDHSDTTAIHLLRPISRAVALAPLELDRSAVTRRVAFSPEASFWSLRAGGGTYESAEPLRQVVAISLSL